MQAPSSSGRALERTAAVTVGVTLALSCTYFFSGGGWNQASHFDLIRALVEQHTVQIDSYHENTGDKSLRDGHYYSNKAPGTAFLAAPFVAATRLLLRGARVDPEGQAGLLWQAQAATFVCATVPTIAAALVLLGLAVRFGATVQAAFFGALMFGLGTPAWIYGASLWSHALCAGCLSLALLAASELSNTAERRRILILGSLFGLALGWAVLAEYQAGGAAFILLLFALSRPQSGNPGRLLLVLATGAGLLVPVLLLAAYNAAAFGSPFTLSYSSAVSYAEGHSQGYLGVTYPKPSVLLSLLFGTQRGLFFHSPVLLSAPVGLYLLSKNPQGRKIALVASAVVIYYLLFNASYFCWWGGSCFGPRFLVASLPLGCLGLAFAWDQLGPTGRRVLVGLGAASVLNMLVALSTQPMTPESFGAPYQELLLPSFLEGRLSLNRVDAFYSARPAWAFNIGEGMGLSGLWSLVPLVGLWSALAGAWGWKNRPGRGREEASVPASSGPGERLPLTDERPGP